MRDVGSVGGDVAALAALLASAAVFYAAPWPALYVPALFVTCALAVRFPVWSLALVPAFAPFFMRPKHFGHFAHLQPAPQEIFLLVSVVALAVGAARGRVHPEWSAMRSSPFLTPAVLFVIAAVLSSVAAADHRLAFRALYQVVLEPILYAVLLLLFVRRGWEWALLLGTALAAGVFVACVAIGQVIAQPSSSLSPSASFQHVVAFYGSPDNLGLLLDRIFPFWLAIALFAPLRGRARVALLASGVPLLLAVVYSYSRGAWLGVGVASVLLLLRPGWTRYLAIAIVILGGVAGGAKSHSLTAALQTGHAGTGHKRLDIWRSSVNILKAHPILGVGPDNFNYYYAPRVGQQLYSPCRGQGYLIESDPAASNEPCLSHPHNEVLDFWLSTGIIGLIAAVWLQVVFWRSLYRARSTTRWPWRDALVLACGAAMLAGLIHGLVDNSYFLMDLSLLFWLLCVLAQRLAMVPDGMELVAR